MSVFTEYETQQSSEYISAALPDGDITVYMDCLQDEVSGMMISRPVKSRFLDRIIYDIMRLGNFVLYAPDGEFPVVSDTETSLHLPEGMLESLGEPRTAESAEALSRLLKEMYGQQC